MYQFRGVAQLIARSVWDREVEGLSPFTPTNKKSVQLDRFFLVLFIDINFRLFAKNSRRLGTAIEATESSRSLYGLISYQLIAQLKEPDLMSIGYC